MSDQVLHAILGGLEDIKKELAAIREKQEIQEKKLEKLEVANEVQNQKLENLQANLDLLADKFIEKKAHFDWNLLPLELKVHCIKQMDFKTRTKLRCSSKSDMRLVDSVKHKFELFEFFLDGTDGGCELSADDAICNIEQFKSEQQFEKVASFMRQVLRHEIEELGMTLNSDEHGNKDEKLLAAMIRELPVLKIERLDIPIDPQFTIGIEILKRCNVDSLAALRV